jgi:hypothetical protein
MPSLCFLSKYPTHISLSSSSALHHACLRGLDSSITPSAAACLYSPHDLARKVLCNVRDVAERIRMGEKIPATSAVTVVIEPRAEDEVGGDCEEDTRNTR